MHCTLGGRRSRLRKLNEPHLRLIIPRSNQPPQTLRRRHDATNKVDLDSPVFVPKPGHKGKPLDRVARPRQKDWGVASTEIIRGAHDAAYIETGKVAWPQ